MDAESLALLGKLLMSPDAISEYGGHPDFVLCRSVAPSEVADLDVGHKPIPAGREILGYCHKLRHRLPMKNWYGSMCVWP